jgi:hypothetical protein
MVTDSCQQFFHYTIQSRIQLAPEVEDKEQQTNELAVTVRFFRWNKADCVLSMGSEVGRIE